MSQEEEPKKSAVDPFANMMQFYDNWSKTWANSMSETVANPRFAETMSQQMAGSLEFWSVVRQQVGDAMEQYLQQLSLPTQQEVVSLAERMTTIEMRLDDVEAKLDQILDHLKESQDS
jgi:uncharacterized damage-inducible protein DinB